VSETLTPEPAAAPAGDAIAVTGRAVAAPSRAVPRVRPRVRADVRVVPWRAVPVALAAAGAAAFALLGLHPVDLAAGTFRADLFSSQGFTVWNGQWYGGHHTPGYSILFPPLAALVGPAVLGAVAALVSAALFDALAARHFGPAARAGAAWFGIGVGVLLFTGRMPFALGVAIGLGALLALQRRRPAASVVLAALCTLASPVAGLFVAIAAAAHALTARAAAGAAVAAGALVPPLALALAFPHPGRQMFFATELAWLLFAAAAVWALVPARERALRAGALLYASAGIAAYVVPTPIGNNVTRLGPLVAGPLIVCALAAARERPRRATLAAAAVCLPLLAYSAAWPAYRDAAKVSGDPAAQRSYYTPLDEYLARAGGPPGRVEIPFTRAHWESAAVAARFPLARGWERQLEIERYPIFYGAAPLNAASYGRWLIANGVRWVAVPDAKLDFSGLPERQLIDRGLPYLKLRWRSAHWRVYEHTGPSALAVPDGRARMALTRLDAGGFALRVDRPGSALVRVRWTPYWRAAGACVEPARGGWTRVTATRPGTVDVRPSFSMDRVVSRGRRCS
jgi:hypothetical protein